MIDNQKEMQKEDLKDKPTEKLQADLKSVQTVTGVLIGVCSLLTGICIYGLLMKDNNATFIPLLVVAFSCSLIIPMNYMNVTKIKKELKSRD